MFIKNYKRCPTNRDYVVRFQSFNINFPTSVLRKTSFYNFYSHILRPCNGYYLRQRYSCIIKYTV